MESLPGNRGRPSQKSPQKANSRNGLRLQVLENVGSGGET
jgi:hypothetical protein